MKGPGLKSRLDVRRVWKCPATGKLLRTPGDVTQMLSPFCRDTKWMELVEEQQAPRPDISLDEIIERMTAESPEPETEQSGKPESNSEANEKSETPAETNEPDSTDGK